MEVLFQVLLVLLLAKVLGEFVERLGYPAVLGEVLTGLVLGFFLIQDNTEVLSFLAELGAIFLLFTAGYGEVHLRDLKASSKKAMVATLFQILVAFASGFLLGWYFDLGFLTSMFMGVAFSPTSIGVVVKTLVDMDYLSSKPGTMMLTTAIFDDIIGIFLLSVVVTMAQYDQIPSMMQILVIAGKLMFFIVVMAILGRYVFSRLFTYIHRMHVKESIFAFVVIVALFSTYICYICF